MKKQDFVHLHVHSEFSLQDSLLSASHIASLAKDDHSFAVGLSDLHNLFGAVKFYKQCCQVGVKPLIGCEVDIYDDCAGDDVFLSPESRGYKLILYCQNNQGLVHLSQLLSRSFRDQNPAEQKRWIHRSWLHEQICSGLIAIEPGLSGFSGKNQLQSYAELEPWLALFPGRYYLGLHRLGFDKERSWEWCLFNNGWAEKVPLVALGQVCFATEKDFLAHEIRVCIQEGRVLQSQDDSRFSPLQYWLSQEKMCSIFSDLPYALENTVEIAKRCQVDWSFDQTFLPDFKVPKGMSLAQQLEKQTLEGLKQRGEHLLLQDDYQARIREELGIIDRMGFAGYFLIVADFIQWAKKNGVPVGPGRGSGAGSLVAYGLAITDIDPLVHGLLFERFLNPERVSMPDFDIDFCMLGRDKVIAYVAEHYGKRSVAQIITHGSMAAKAAIRDVGRVLAHPYGFVDKLAKLVPLDLGMTLTQALKVSTELAARYRDEHEVKALLDHALTLEGRVRNVGRHAGGVVIAPGDLSDFCPVYMEQANAAQVTQFDMGDVEAVGLVKFDFLGLRTLTIIAHCCEHLKKAGFAQNLDISDIPLDDEKTFKLLKSGKTTAVFQLESRGFQELIERLEPDVFPDIVALVALYRPGPLQSGMVDDFIERKHGRAEVSYLHPCMADLLKETYGVIVYQEQVMQIAQAMAGYTLGAADLLRRAMGKKKPEEMAKQRDIFVEGSLKNNIDQDIAENVFDLMEKFAGYGFNKSHSVAYAYISYQTAYLKAHFPDYFMAAVLSSDMDNTDKVVHYIQDCFSRGLKVLPPSLEHSQAMFHVSSPNEIRFALGAIKGVGEAMAEWIVAIREQSGPYTDLLDFALRMEDKLNRKVLEALIFSGALDCFGRSRSSLLASLEHALAQKDQMMRHKKAGQQDLFGLGQSDNDPTTDQSFVYQKERFGWGQADDLREEKNVLGMYFSGHPLDPYIQEIKKANVARISGIFKRSGPKSMWVAGVMVSQKRMTTKAGKMFLLLVLEDHSGVIEMACFDDKMVQAIDAMEEHAVLFIHGTTQSFKNQVRFVPKQIVSLAKWREQKVDKVCLTFAKRHIQDKKHLQVWSMLSQYATHATASVRFCFQESDDRKVWLHGQSDIKVAISDRFLTEIKQLLGDEAIFFDYRST